MTKKTAKKKVSKKHELKGETAHADVTTQVGSKDAPEQTTSESLGVVMGDALASVTVGLGHTKNIGNYESMRVTVSVTIPCINRQQHLDAAAEFAYQYANDRVTRVFKEAGLLD